MPNVECSLSIIKRTIKALEDVLADSLLGEGELAVESQKLVRALGLTLRRAGEPKKVKTKKGGTVIPKKGKRLAGRGKKPAEDERGKKPTPKRKDSQKGLIDLDKRGVLDGSTVKAGKAGKAGKSAGVSVLRRKGRPTKSKQEKLKKAEAILDKNTLAKVCQLDTSGKPCTARILATRTRVGIPQPFKAAGPLGEVERMELIRRSLRRLSKQGLVIYDSKEGRSGTWRPTQ